MLKVNEIFYSIQGESTYAGRPCIFIRLTGCNLNCKYCDTKYAFYDGKDLSVESILKEIKKYKCNLVEITGGEPLLQQNVYKLINKLCKEKYEVMLETNGSLSIKQVNEKVKIVMDLKCPSSRMEKFNNYDNLKFIKINDEIKFVIANKKDYEWCKKIIEKFQIQKLCTILFSPVYGILEPKKLAGWILKDNLPGILQIQIQKYIWPNKRKGV